MVGDADWDIMLIEPETLFPGSQAELEFRIENHEPNNFQIKGILLSPTWDLEHTYEKTTEVEVEGESKTPLPTIEFDIPKHLGGKHGFHVGFKVDVGPSTNVIWLDQPHRLPVEAQSYEVVFGVKGGSDEDFVHSVEKEISNWGFNIKSKFSDQRTLADMVGEPSNDVDAIILASTSDTDADNNDFFVYTSAETGLEKGIPVFIIDNPNARIDVIPQNVVLTQPQALDSVSIAKEVGPALHDLRKGINYPQLLDILHKMDLRRIGATFIAEKAAEKSLLTLYKSLKPEISVPDGTERYVDLARDTHYSGQKFYLIPFDWDYFSHRSYVDSFYLHNGNQEFLRALNSSGIRKVPVDALSIAWSQPENGESSYRTLFTMYDTSRIALNLPSGGHFMAHGRRSSNWKTPGFTHDFLFHESRKGMVERITYYEIGKNVSSINDEWMAQFFVQSDRASPEVYIPVRRKPQAHHPL